MPTHARKMVVNGTKAGSVGPKGTNANRSVDKMIKGSNKRTQAQPKKGSK